MHLGGEASNFREFWDFLDWLTSLPDTGKAFSCNGEEVSIKKPGTLVLLGDILELWDPEDDDRNNVTADVLAPLSTLINLGCDIIYVIGNHDEDLLDFKHAMRKKTVAFPPKGSFDIVYRSYPRKNARTGLIEGVQIGKPKYTFLHGQQFDRLQVFYWLSKVLSKKMKRQVRIDPIDWCQDLANVSFTRNIGLKTNGASLLFGLLLVFYLLLSYFWFAGVPLGSRWGVLWVIISSFFVLTVLPKVVTFANTEIWRRLPGIVVEKCKSVEEVITSRYVEKRGDKINANIVVFGHTHNPGKYFLEKKERWFINTGSWVELSAKCKMKGVVPNTFLYIDTEAPYLLQWDKEKVAKGEITCLEDFKGIIR